MSRTIFHSFNKDNKLHSNFSSKDFPSSSTMYKIGSEKLLYSYTPGTQVLFPNCPNIEWSAVVVWSISFAPLSLYHIAPPLALQLSYKCWVLGKLQSCDALHGVSPGHLHLCNYLWKSARYHVSTVHAMQNILTFFIPEPMVLQSSSKLQLTFFDNHTTSRTYNQCE